MKNKSERGQILLIVVLTMIVALTVGLSIAARMVTELKFSKQNEESQRAFQAAEAGIQQTLEKKDVVKIDNIGNNSKVLTAYDASQGQVIILNNGQEVDQDVGADVWLSNYSTTPQDPSDPLYPNNPTKLFGNPMGNISPVPITMFWGSKNQIGDCNSTGDNVPPAIEVVLLRGPIGSPTIQKSVYEATGTGCPRINNAKPGTSDSYTPKLGGPQFQYAASLTFTSGGLELPESKGLVMKVIPLFNSTIIGFQSTTPSPNQIDFPAQGAVVTSTGTSGDTIRKVEYFQSYPQLPLEVFPYSLLSQ